MQIETTNYKDELDKLQALADKTRYGDMSFNQDEVKANLKFVEIKNKLLPFLPNDFHLGYTLRYKNSSICEDLFYKLICKMPKGAVNHSHFGTCFDWNNLVPLLEKYNVKIEPKTNRLLINKEAERPDAIDISHLDRRNYQLETAFNKHEKTWPVFESSIWKVMNAVQYHKLLKEEITAMCYDYLEEGNCDILEVRYLFGFAFDENGKSITYQQDIEMLVDIITEVKKKHPQFHYNVIASSLKVFTKDQIYQYFADIIHLIKTNENAKKLIKGFDLVTEEDLNMQLNELTDIFLKIEQLQVKEGLNIPWIFHVGESLKHSNNNLYDSLIFKTKRMGHGLNLVKHSYFMDTIKERGICIESNPISNQVLEYYYDLRTHPLQTFFNYGIKVTISPDSNGYYGSKCNNDDFFVVATCMDFDLKGLKKLCLNSLECSLLDESEKKAAIEFWNKKWIGYIAYINKLTI